MEAMKMASSLDRYDKLLETNLRLARALEHEEARRRQLESFLQRLATPHRWAKHWVETEEPWKEVVRILDRSPDTQS